MARVVVAMSGGVDSSVSAYLMKKQGHEVIGLFMKNWDEVDENGVCSAQSDFEDVARVCEHLQIPYYSVNFTEQYRDRVFTDFLKEYEAGYTPNPDILCNREIKFKVLLEKAESLGGEILATGHYCQIQERVGRFELIKGADVQKDQTYFLYTLQEHHLPRIQFPIGHLLKPQVRALARELDLCTHSKKDSTGICFIGKRDFREFLSQYIAIKEGDIVDIDSGKHLGMHQGIAFYTIGQRKGMGIGGPGDAWFVVGKRKESNELLVAQGENHPALFAPGLFASDVSWIHQRGLQEPMRCDAKIRYRHPGESCLVTKESNGLLRVVFDNPQRAITPRQSIVFYQGDICLGGAMITTSFGGLMSPLTP